jgi:uncharacterized protein (UPF0335 family)
MEINTQETIEQTKEYVKRILYIENEIKGLKEDIKAIKAEAKEDGILTKEINKAINLIKAEVKAQSNPAESSIINEYVEAFKDDEDIYHSIVSLLEK